LPQNASFYFVTLCCRTCTQASFVQRRRGEQRHYRGMISILSNCQGILRLTCCSAEPAYHVSHGPLQAMRQYASALRSSRVLRNFIHTITITATTRPRVGQHTQHRVKSRRVRCRPPRQHKAIQRRDHARVVGLTSLQVCLVTNSSSSCNSASGRRVTGPT